MSLPDRISNVDIIEIARALFGSTMVRQVVQKNLLSINKRAGIYFINLQSKGQRSWDGMTNGTHWTVLLVMPGAYYYFDSFGFQPPTIVDRKLQGFDSTWNQDWVQPLESELCGFYCLMAMNELLNNGGSVDMNGSIIKTNGRKLFTSSLKANDRLVRKFKNSL